MSLDLRLKPQVRRDLRAIALYIARANQDINSGQVVALRLARRFQDILHAPGMGAPYHERSGVRKINEGPYKIFYRVAASEVIILRIWDGRRGHDPALA